MLKRKFYHTNYEHSSIVEEQQQPPMPDHLKCGEVFTWLCDGELYAVECKLCEDQPLCPLSEYPQHMEVWHTDWQTFTLEDQVDDEEENPNVLVINDRAVSFTSEDSGSFKPNDQLQNGRVLCQEEHEEILEPFEQVLIEQDISIHTQQINEYSYADEDEEYFKDANVQVAEAKQSQKQNKHTHNKQSRNRNHTLKYTIKEQRATTNEAAESTQDLEALKKFSEPTKLHVNENETKDLSNKHNYVEFRIKPANSEKNVQKCKNYKRNFTNINENVICNGDSETSDAENSAARKTYNKSGKITKIIKQNLTKIENIKRTLSEIVKDISELKDNDDETESESIEDEGELNALKTNYSNNKKKYLSNNWKGLTNLGKTFETENKTSEMEKETSETEKETTKFERINRESAGQYNKTEKVNKNCKKFVKSIKKSLRTNKNRPTRTGKYAKQFRKAEERKTLRINNIKVTENKTKINDNEINKLEMLRAKSEVKRKAGENETNKAAIKFNKTKENEIEAEQSESQMELNEREMKLNGDEMEQNEKGYEIEKNENETKLNENKTKLNDNSTKLSANETELSENEIEMKLNDNSTELSENVRKVCENKTVSFENITKEIEEELTEEETKPIQYDEYVMKLSVRAMEQNNNETESNETEADLSENEIEAMENETNRSENEIEPKKSDKVIENENTLNAVENKTEIKNINQSEHKQNKSGTSECAKSLYKNKSPTTSNGTAANESETFHNENIMEIYENKKGTSGIEINYAKYDECIQKSVETRKKIEKCLRKLRKCRQNPNDYKAGTHETSPNENETIICKNFEETREVNPLESLQKSLEVRKKAQMYLRRSNRRNLKGNETDETNGSEKLPNVVTNILSANIKEKNANETNNAKYFECLQKSLEIRKKAEKYLKRKQNLKINLNENEKLRKATTKQYESVTEEVANENKDDEQNLRTTRKSLRLLSKNSEHSQNGKQEINKNYKSNSNNVEETSHSDSRKRTLAKNFIEPREKKQKGLEKRKSNESETDDQTDQTLEAKEKIKQTFKYKDLIERNEHKRKHRNYESKRENSAPNPSQSFKQTPSNQSHQTTELSWKGKIVQKTLKRNKYSLENTFTAGMRLRGESSCEDADSSSEFGGNSDLEESSEIAFTVSKRKIVKRLSKREEDNFRDTDIYTDSTVQAKEKFPKDFGPKEHKCLESLNLTQQEDMERSSKQILVTQLSGSEDDKQVETAKSSENFEKHEVYSPRSPQTEEEHFEFYEAKERLNKQQIIHLIKLYHEHARLWDQSHPEFCEPQVCRKSWQQITEQWNEFCKRNFTIAEVRIRICTLCQRFLQERDRLALEGEVDECVKFPYYEQMQFLEQQKSLQKRRELYEQQNEKILEIYQHFPVLWHISCYKLRKAKERAKAIANISKALKLFGLNLSSILVQKRLRSLRKCYRLEKIRHLHAQVEQTPFEPMFRHYERMHFLDKHIDPFACGVCGKIFENFQGFRQHLEAEFHGSVVPEESDKATGESSSVKIPRATRDELDVNEETCLANTTQVNELNEIEIEGEKIVVFSPIPNQIESFSESENSRDILQRFSPFSSAQNSFIDLATDAQPKALENSSSINPQVLNFPLNTPNESIINSLHLEDQLIEEIMENVNNSDSLSQQGLDQFIKTVTSRCEESQTFELSANNCVTEEILSPNIFHTENSFVVEHPDIVTDQSSHILSLSPIAESLTPLHLYTENSFIIEHPDIVTQQTDVESFVPDLRHTKASAVVEHPDIATDAVLEKDIDHPLNAFPNVKGTSPVKELENQITEPGDTENLSPAAPLVVKVQCPAFSVDLQLMPESTETLNDSDNEMFSSADISTIPLPDHLIHKMIETYRKFPQLWNPNHLDFNSRTLRRQAWCALTTEFNSAVGQQISWRTLHRKLTDYAKYFKKLIMEQEDYEQVENKWAFYEDFKFMHDVIAVNNELQRNVHQRDNNFQIIAIYKTFPQLWDTKHSDYNKRGTKQRNIEIMCNKLQEENNLQMTTERLKYRLIELRMQYRTAKKQRLKCLKDQQEFSSNDFEFYEALNFLDDHIDPFICVKCKMEFKNRTDYNLHLTKEHTQKSGTRNRSSTILPHEPGAENICHICGIKFTTRSNLVHHVKRHEGIRNYACTMCPKKFYASHSLKVHIRSHTKECPYTCEKCGMSFVSASKLNQHVKRHLNKKDFQCDFCPKAFFTAFEKDRHERRHLNIRDKACPICGKTFVAGSSYYAHLMLHNDKKRFECDKCDMKFAQYAGLYKHKKRHHD